VRILLLNQAFYPDVVSTAQHLQDFAVRLAERGHEVTVVASRRSYDKPQVLFAPYEEWKGIRIHRVMPTGFGKKAKWRRAVDFASFLMGCSWRMLRLPRPDAVVALTSPPLIAFLGAWLSLLRGCPMVYWVMDLNPDEAVAAGWLKQGSIASSVLEWMSRFSLKRAHRIVVLDRFMKDRVLSKGIDASKVFVLPPWSHDEAVRFDHHGRERFRAAHGLQDKFVVMHSGNHSPCHPVDTVLEAARCLANEPQYAFCFVGGGSQFAKVRDFAQYHELGNIHCLPYQPLQQLAGSLSAADLHVVVMGRQFVGTIHPCKIYNILQIGSPVLYVGPSPSHIASILDDLRGSPHCGRAEHGDVEGVIRVIRAIALAGGRGQPDLFGKVAGKFSTEALLPPLVDVLERGCGLAAEYASTDPVPAGTGSAGTPTPR
jgi:colanic acid biosynthesis glycosyl transferase WcaI